MQTNKLQFKNQLHRGKQTIKLCIATSLYAYNKIYRKKTCRREGLRVIPGKHKCLCSFPNKGFQKQQLKATNRLFMTAVAISSQYNKILSYSSLALTNRK